MTFLLFAKSIRVKPTGEKKLMLVSGALIGFTSNILGAVGPLMAPFFIALNLNKNEFVGKHLLGKVSEDLFRKLLHGFLALIAGKLLIWDGIWPLLAIH
ncbi:MAG: hypothetical protein RIB59_14060 [Rhodospirillales bacterium]